MSRRGLWLAYSVGAFGLGMGNTVQFLMTVRARELGASFEVVGLIVAAAAIVPAVMSIPIGVAVDRLGARRSFILGAAGSSLLALFAVFAASYWTLLWIQLAFGVTRGVGWLGSQSYVTGLASGQRRAEMSGKFGFFSNLGTMLAPLASGAVAQAVGFRSAFYFAAAYGAMFFVLGLALVKDANSESRPSQAKQGAGFRSAAKLLALPGIQAAMFLTGARLWLAKSFNGFVPVYLIESGIDPTTAAAVISISGLTATVIAPTAGLWTRFLRPPMVTVLALGCGALGLAIVPLLLDIPLVFIPAVLAGIGSGLSLPLLLAIVTDAAKADQRGLALGLRQTVNNAAGSGAPVLVGVLIGLFGASIAFPVSGAVAAMLLTAAGAITSRATSSQPSDLPRSNA